MCKVLQGKKELPETQQKYFGQVEVACRRHICQLTVCTVNYKIGDIS